MWDLKDLSGLPFCSGVGLAVGVIRGASAGYSSLHLQFTMLYALRPGLNFVVPSFHYSPIASANEKAARFKRSIFLFISVPLPFLLRARTKGTKGGIRSLAK